MDVDAEQAALAQVASLLQRPDQLEKLPELRKRAERKKAAVEAMLRTGVQSQLEGIRTAMAHLYTAAEDITAVESGIQAIRLRLKPFPALKEKMSELRDANVRHGQYAAAMENLKNIFNINQTVADARIALEQGKLLQAHKHIMDLELARDELLFEVHKMNSPNKENEKNLLVTYFNKVDQLVADLGSNMWFILSRALEMIKGSDSGSGPQELVTCLRIVEREERIDKYYIDRKVKSNSFVPPGRPRKWREKAFQVMEKTVYSRVEGNQLEDRTNNKAWLARYLEVCRRVVIEDLLLAKAAVPCFPPEYQIYDRYVHMYHNRLCNRIREIVKEPLEKSELVQLMSWIQSYAGEELLGNPRLKVNASALLEDYPVLPRNDLDNICNDFIKLTQSDMQQWLAKTLSTEKDDWYKQVRPEEDNFQYFYTSLPNILFGMLRDTVTLAKEVSVEVIPSVINLIIEKFFEFAKNYQDAFTAYKNKYFEDRNLFAQTFTATMISIANNLHTCIESTERYMQQVRLSMEDDGGSLRRGPSRQEILENIAKLNRQWNIAMTTAIKFLMDEICEDLAPSLTKLFTKNWLLGSEAPETICITLKDYYHDYSHLRPGARYALLVDLHYKIVGEYIKAINTMRLTFANFDERQTASKRLVADAHRIEEVFSEMSQDMNENFTYLTPVLEAISSVIGLRDKSLLSLEATGFGRNFPNVPVDLLTALISCREDINGKDARQLAEEVVSHVQFHPKNSHYDRLFSTTTTESSWKPTVEMMNVLSTFMRKV